MPNPDNGSRVSKGAVICRDDRAAALATHGATLNRGVGNKGDDIGAVCAAHRGEYSAVIFWGNGDEFTVVKEVD
ncbi:unannotated protein [freshwater metagenome]|uniref:Unannotated protein n=1 Tax=freshwater metagenome TaxID=449393 RepID=A0A6J7DSJ9_9ZZZZ